MNARRFHSIFFSSICVDFVFFIYVLIEQCMRFWGSSCGAIVLLHFSQWNYALILVIARLFAVFRFGIHHVSDWWGMLHFLLVISHLHFSFTLILFFWTYANSDSSWSDGLSFNFAEIVYVFMSISSCFLWIANVVGNFETVKIWAKDYNWVRSFYIEGATRLHPNFF